MFVRQATVLILLAAVLVSAKAHCQEETSGREIFTLVGQVTKADADGGVINVISAAVDKQAFSDAHLDADVLWNVLIKNGYIDDSGTIEAPFYALDRFSSMVLPKKFRFKKKLIYAIFQNALADNGQKRLFYITFNSELLQGAHNITSIDITEGDPVTIQYDKSSPDKNNIIRLVDNKPDDS